MPEGFLVIAPDRGFLGNEEMRDSFQPWSRGHNAELVFVTDERTKDNLERAVHRLHERGALNVSVLPFFVSAHHPRLQLARKLLGLSPGAKSGSIELPMPVRMTRPFGESYFAVEVLSDRLRTIKESQGRRLIAVGFGATNETSHKGMLADWQTLVHRSSKGFGFEAARVVIARQASPGDRENEAMRLSQALQEASSDSEAAIVVAFHLGMKLDSMMSLSGRLRRMLPEGAEFVDGDPMPHPAVTMWLQREANRRLSVGLENTGVVFLAHGSDFHWNDTMRGAVAELSRRYKIEFAFSMADQPIVERAIRRLEQRGARAIVIVRVFGMQSSFQSSVERMIGADIEHPKKLAGAIAMHAHHGHGPSGPPAPRIRSSAIMTTVGGLEADELFADALLVRAKAASKDASQETVILVAHGAGEDARNDHWIKTLESIAARMKQTGGDSFRSIRVGTWREDWPDKRITWVKKIRDMVVEARQGEGQAIVVPARTTGTGPARELLEGLEFELASGFAPHPLFASWIEKQIHAGLQHFEQSQSRGDWEEVAESSANTDQHHRVHHEHAGHK